jgi:transposase-like protein
MSDHPLFSDSLYDLTENFRTNHNCLEYLEHIRWNGTVRCPWTHSTNVYRAKDDAKGRKVYVSRDYLDGKRKFNVRTNTIFHDAQIELKQWFMGSFLHMNHKKGISSHQLGRFIRVEQATAFDMQMKMRAVCGHPALRKIMGQLVQMDEAFFGGKFKNMHEAKKKLLRENGASADDKTVRNKTAVFGIMDNMGKVYTVVVPDTRSATLIPIIKDKVKEGSIIVTDEWKAYNPLANENYYHFKVNHSAKNYVVADPDAAEIAIDDFVDDLHNNNIERHWGATKRSYVGTYHHISPERLPLYLMEWDFRNNTREMSDGDRFEYFLKHSENNDYHEQLLRQKKAEEKAGVLNEYKTKTEGSQDILPNSQRIPF